MKYVFLTNSMGGYSGGPTYVHNKMNFLKEKGWDVIVFDTTGFTNAIIKIEDFREFDKNRYQELFYNPYWLWKTRREKILREIITKIGTDVYTVIESNNPVLSMWGELIARRIGARHLVYLISENLVIKDKSLYSFFRVKADRKELFSISSVAYKLLFEKFEEVTDAISHKWSAGVYVAIEDVECAELDNVKKADYNIGHFGRQKAYFLSMLKEVSKFALRHNREKVNFILLGLERISNEMKATLPENVNIYCVASRQPIPKKFFDLSDVVIASAGCAWISFHNDAIVISMDVVNHSPLGILGYNTYESNLRSKSNYYNKDLAETLEDVLVHHSYNYPIVRNKPRGRWGYEYQLTFAKPSDGTYYDVRKINYPNNVVFNLATRLLLKMNLVGLCSLIRYKMIKKITHK